MNNWLYNHFVTLAWIVAPQRVIIKALDVLRYGDGGVDVTGVPNCKAAEGVALRRWKNWSFGILFQMRWGLHFFNFSPFYYTKILINEVLSTHLPNIPINPFFKNLLSQEEFIKPNIDALRLSCINQFLKINSVSLKPIGITYFPQFSVFQLSLPQVSLANQLNENFIDSLEIQFLRVFSVISYCIKEINKPSLLIHAAVFRHRTALKCYAYPPLLLDFRRERLL